jgi:hypothetical protein
MVKNPDLSEMTISPWMEWPMTLLKKKIEDELDHLDIRDMPAIYDYLRQLSRLRRLPVNKPTVRVPSIQHLHELTATSKGSWAESLIHEREERL